jgi:hypothetical protein
MRLPLVTHRYPTELAFVYDLATLAVVARVSGYSKEAVADYVYNHPDLRFNASTDGVAWDVKPSRLVMDDTTAYLDMRLLA